MFMLFLAYRSSVDDLVCELEAPVDIAELNLIGAQLKQLLLEILERFRLYSMFCC